MCVTAENEGDEEVEVIVSVDIEGELLNRSKESCFHDRYLELFYSGTPLKEHP